MEFGIAANMCLKNQLVGYGAANYLLEFAQITGRAGKVGRFLID